MAPLFEGVIYHIPASIGTDTRAELEKVLQQNGASSTLSAVTANHIITDTVDFEGCDLVSEDIPRVTPFWVARSELLQMKQNSSCYSPDPGHIFSGVVACASDIPKGDQIAICAGILAQGGQWRDGLTKEVTHLFCLVGEGRKYEVAMAHQSVTNVVVLLPHWFDDCFKTQHRLPTAQYEFPNPPLLNENLTKGEKISNHNNDQLDAARKKHSLFNNMTLPSPKRTKNKLPEVNIWHGRKILLSQTLDLEAGRRETVEVGIQRTGGQVIKLDARSEEDAVLEADIFITQWRSGPAYVKAVKQGKIIGTLPYLLYVEQFGAITVPTDQLLHYPVRSYPVPGFETQEITITNYTGKAREYLRKLITTMGGTFTPTMSVKNTVVVAAMLTGTKTDKAKEWGIPTVNHTWLEDCFVNWRLMTVGMPRYIQFPPGVNYMEILGQRSLGRVGPEQLDELLKEENPPVGDQPTFPVQRLSSASAVRHGTGSSAKDALEVERVVGLEVVNEAEDHDVGENDVLQCEPPPQHSKVVTSTASPSRATQVEDYPDLHTALSISIAREKERRNTGTSPRTPGVFISGKGDKGKGNAIARKQPNGQMPRDVLQEMEDIQSSPVTPKKRRTADDSPSLKKQTPRLPAISDDEAPVHTQQSERRIVSRGHMREGLSAQVTQSPRRRIVSVDIPLSPNRSMSPPKKLVPATSSLSPPMKKSKGPRPSWADKGKQPKKADRIQSIREPSPITVDEPDEQTDDSFHRLPSKRGAAVKASQKLKVIMPDVNNFQKEMRKGEPWKKRLRLSDGDGMEMDSDRSDPSVETRTLKKRRVEFELESGKIEAFNELPLNENHGPLKRMIKYSSHKDGSQARNSLSSLNVSRLNPSKIRLVITQVTLDDAETEVIACLGAKINKEPTEKCTHLVAKAIQRTEKFLCAISSAPYVLSEAWLRDSIAARRFLDEDDYLLEDPINEEKYKMKLSEALKRAKAHPSKLLMGHTFYMTEKTKMAMETLKNIVNAAGGKVDSHQRQPTYRMMVSGSNRHLISDPQDKAIWRPLAEKGIPVYSREMILTVILKQEIDWESRELRLDL